MPKVCDVAEYILLKLGPMSAMKLQKLCYYSKAWYLVWAEKELFSERIEAWANGPVIPDLYQKHRGNFIVAQGELSGNLSTLTEDQKDAIDRVLEFYGNREPQWLSDLTHMEDPWRNARFGVPDGERSNRVITPAAMHEYYSSL